MQGDKESNFLFIQWRSSEGVMGAWIWPPMNLTFIGIQPNCLWFCVLDFNSAMGVIKKPAPWDNMGPCYIVCNTVKIFI